MTHAQYDGGQDILETGQQEQCGILGVPDVRVLSVKFRRDEPS